jgi:hypothetical protein
MVYQYKGLIIDVGLWMENRKIGILEDWKNGMLGVKLMARISFLNTSFK